MRPLATLFLVLGAADLAVLNLLVGPAALAGGAAARGSGAGDRAEPASIPPGPGLSALPPPPTARPLPVAVPDPVAVAVPVPVPVPAPHPAPAPDPGEHPDSLPAAVTLHFALDDGALDDRARAALDRVADLLEVRGELAVTLAGHADESGSQEHNQLLSEQRAQAAADYLADAGVESGRLTVRAFGELQPLAPGHERDRRNRRVELRFHSRAAQGDPE
jgi:outer membrane protein OmpA-like peptidoglycan-associated protein